MLAGLISNTHCSQISHSTPNKPSLQLQLDSWAPRSYIRRHFLIRHSRKKLLLSVGSTATKTMHKHTQFSLDSLSTSPHTTPVAPTPLREKIYPAMHVFSVSDPRCSSPASTPAYCVLTSMLVEFSLS